MSAYLVSPIIIGILAAAIAERTTDHGDAATVAKTLANENLRSVGYRYGTNDNKTAKDFLGMTAAAYRQQSAEAATDPCNSPGYSLAQLQDLAGTYAYQACECDDWPETKAAQVLRALEATTTVAA